MVFQRFVTVPIFLMEILDVLPGSKGGGEAVSFGGGDKVVLAGLRLPVTAGSWLGGLPVVVSNGLGDVEGAGLLVGVGKNS